MTEQRNTQRAGRRETDRIAPLHMPVTLFLGAVGVIQLIVSFGLLGGLRHIDADQHALQKDCARTKEIVIDSTKRIEKMQSETPKKDKRRP
jgi:hypothetical protein